MVVTRYRHRNRKVFFCAKRFGVRKSSCALRFVNVEYRFDLKAAEGRRSPRSLAARDFIDYDSDYDGDSEFTHDILNRVLWGKVLNNIVPGDIVYYIFWRSVGAERGLPEAERISDGIPQWISGVPVFRNLPNLF